MAKSNTPLRVIPLGGVGEIGKNMLAIELGDDMVVVDAGLMFPDEGMLGIDIVIPDMTYLRQRKTKIRGFLITHAHEDHIGALPYALRDLLDVPIYGTKLTIGLIRTKLREHKLADRATFREIAPGTPFNIGNFRCDSYYVCHSIPDAVGVTIDTPYGALVHSGDWKFDHTPVDGRQTDFARLAAIAAKGVLLLMSDSTRAEMPGYTQSERHVAEMFDAIMSRAPGRVITTTFASNISRIRQIVEIAAAWGRMRATQALAKHNVQYAVVGGNAVAAWVATVDPEAVRNTRHVDVMIRRKDFDAAKHALESEGFIHRKVAGIDLFLDDANAKPRTAVHIIYDGEFVRDGEPLPNPGVEQSTQLDALRVLNLDALVRIKLTAFRDKDRTHVRDLIDVGLVDHSWTANLPSALAARLQSLLDTPEG